MLIHIQSVEEFDKTIAEGNVLVDFFATWCGPCNMLAPVLEQLSKEEEGLTIAKVDVDELPALARRYGIASIPTLIHFVNGAQKATAMGYMPKPKLLAFLAQ